jgi:hypothetical protein
MYDLTPGKRVRFFSYLGADNILGLEPDRFGWPRTALKHMSTDNNASTMFFVEAAEKDCFRLRWTQSVQGTSPAYLSWASAYRQLVPVISPSQYRPPANHWDWEDKGISPSSDGTLFRVDAVKDGNWFALNNLWRQEVLDIDHGITARNTLIYAFPWNGGDNQIWRTEAV